MLILAAVALVAFWAPSVLADDAVIGAGGPQISESGAFVIGSDSASGSLISAPQKEDPGVGGYGFFGRVGHEAGPTVGRTESVSFLDVVPYLFHDETMLFGDLRLVISNDGQMGGSTGIGLRHFFENYNAVAGTAFYYDHDETRGKTFEQFGISAEILTEWLDWRTNVYIPFGRDEQILDVRFEPGSEMFVDAVGSNGSNIAFQRRTFIGSAMEGFDMDFTVPIPGEFFESINTELTAGWYGYQVRGRDNPDAYGWKLRLDGSLFERVLNMFVEVTSDKVFDNNVIFGADVNYWHRLEKRKRIGQSQFNRMADYVRRRRTIVVQESSFLNAPELAINPDTGDPYLVLHVRNVPSPPPPNFPFPTGNGSISTPYQFIQEAQADPANADIIFVHADSVYDNVPVVIQDGELIIGEGVDVTIPVVGLSNGLTLPRATNGTNAPIFQDTVGPAVTLGNGSTFAGFDIIDTLGTAILGDTTVGSNIQAVRVLNTTGTDAHGIHLLNTTGGFAIEDVSIDGTEGTAFFVEGGSPVVVFDGMIDNASGFSVDLNGIGGSVNMLGTTINDDGGLGIRVTDSAANVTFDEANLFNTAGPAVQVFNHAGSVSFSGNVSIDNAAGVAFDVDQIQSLGNVSIQGDLSIDNRNDIGLDLTNIDGTFTTAGAISMGTPAGGTGAGINIQNNAGTLRFQNVTINGSGGFGVLIGDLAGTNVNTDTAEISFDGFTAIDGTAETAFALFNDNSRVTTNGLNITNRNFVGIEVFNHIGEARFLGINSISNELGVGVPAVDVQDTPGVVQFNIVNATNTTGLPGVFVDNNPGEIAFSTLNVNSIDGDSVQLTNNNLITVGTGILDAENGRAITVANNVEHTVVFESVSATNSDFGILVFDSPGTFAVTGTGAAASGGTITLMTAAGASFTNTDEAGLAFMEINNSANGVLFDTLDVAMLDSMLISDIANDGVNALDVLEMVVEDSLFTNITGQHLQYDVATDDGFEDDDNDGIDDNDDPDNYFLTVQRNSFQDGGTVLGTDMMLVRTVTGGTGAILDFLFVDNGTPGSGVFGVTANRTLASALNVQWNGPLNATISRNSFFLLSGGFQTGVEILQGQAGASADVVYSENTLASAGASDAGIDFDFAGPTLLDVINNFAVDPNNANSFIPGFQFGGDASTAMFLRFRAPNNSVFIEDNLIEFTGILGDGIVFPLVAGPSRININGNEMRFATLSTGNTFSIERAVVFQSVVGGITLSGARDNVIFNADQFLIIPAGVSTGSILFNGTPLP